MTGIKVESPYLQELKSRKSDNRMMWLIQDELVIALPDGLQDLSAGVLDQRMDDAKQEQNHRYNLAVDDSALLHVCMNFLLSLNAASTVMLH